LRTFRLVLLRNTRHGIGISLASPLALYWSRRGLNAAAAV
jgi:hypothetical protein